MPVGLALDTPAPTPRTRARRFLASTGARGREGASAALRCSGASAHCQWASMEGFFQIKNGARGEWVHGLASCSRMGAQERAVPVRARHLLRRRVQRAGAGPPRAQEAVSTAMQCQPKPRPLRCMSAQATGGTDMARLRVTGQLHCCLDGVHCATP